MELFRFADKLTRQPADIEKSEVDRLHEGGDDSAILAGDRARCLAVRLRRPLLCRSRRVLDS
jgi:alkylhydroperoxidase family enzyme